MSGEGERGHLGATEPRSKAPQNPRPRDEQLRAERDTEMPPKTLPLAGRLKQGRAAPRSHSEGPSQAQLLPLGFG